MNDLRTAAQQALEAMGSVGADWVCEASHHAKKDQHKGGEPCPLQQRWHVAYQALRAALAEPVQEQAKPDHETRAEIAEHQVVQLAEERDHYRHLWQKAQQAEPQEPVRLQCTTCGTVYADGVPPQVPVQEPGLTVDALRVEFERRYRGKLGITRVEGGAYLSPAIETEWQQFVRKHTAPPQRLPLTEEEIQAAWDSVDMRHPRGNETRIAFARAIERAHGIGGEG